MRSFKWTVVLCGLMLVLTPKPALAWFELLDYLSGPGRFYGAKIDFRVLCFGEDSKQGTVKEIIDAQSSFEEALARSFFSDNHKDWEALVVQLEKLNNSFPVLNRSRLGQVRAAAAALRTEDVKLFRDQYMAYSALRSKKTRYVPPDPGEEQPTPEKPLPPRVPSPLFAVVDDIAALFDQFYKAQASIASTGIFVSFCSPDKIRRYALELGYTTMQANSDPRYANDHTIRLKTYTAALSHRQFAKPSHDVLDIGVIGGVYQFSSRGFDTFYGGTVEPFVDIHGPTSWVNECGLKQLAALVTLRFGLVWFPGGFDTEDFAAAPGSVRHISGWEATPSATIYFNLTPLLRHRPRPF